MFITKAQLLRNRRYQLYTVDLRTKILSCTVIFSSILTPHAQIPPYTQVHPPTPSKNPAIGSAALFLSLALRFFSSFTACISLQLAHGTSPGLVTRGNGYFPWHFVAAGALGSRYESHRLTLLNLVDV